MSSDRPFYVTIPKRNFAYESKKAECYFLGEHIWIPKSQILFKRIEKDQIYLTLPEWVVKEKKLEHWIDEEWDNLGRPD